MIDKNRPLKLVSDKDQRLVKNGEMVAAKNVTISQRGAGTDSILKTVRGFNGVLFDVLNGETTAVDADVTVIGKVEDPQLGYIYLFVATTADGVHTHDMIVRVDANNYDPSAASTAPLYLTVFRNDWLNFDQDGFVSADVVNKAFQQDGVLKSILYFTDNNNPPRKINVDRALAGDYDGYSDAQLDFALSAIKAAPIQPPTFSFETNTAVPINNFERNTFQFAVQYIYKDGELSAIGPYSKLAFPDHIAASGLEGDASGQLYFTDNECIIDTNWRSESSSSVTPETYIKDVSKIRLLGTRDNGATLFVIDEFDANVDLTREIFASSTTIYEASTGLYKFYNDGVYQAVSDNQVNKLYDNVPLKAEGQVVAGDRLMYSNYEEGRPNSETVVNLTARYADEVAGGSVLIADDDTDLIFEDTTARTNGSDDMFWEWDFLDVASFSSDSDIVPGGTLFRTSVLLKPKASVAKGGYVAGYDSANYLLIGSATDQQGYTYNLGVGHFQDADTHIDITAPGNIGTNIAAPSFSTSLSNPEDVTLAAFTDLFYTQVDEFFDGYEIEYTITLAGSEFQAEIFYAPPGASGTTGTKLPVGGKMKVKWGFKVTHPDTTTVKVYPYVKEISQPTSGSLVISGSLGSPAGATTGNFGLDSVNWGLSSGFTDQYLSSNITGGNNVIGPSSQSMRTFAAKTTFKAGCSHELGIVYYDKYNRSGFVNKLGSFYAKHPGERATNRGVCSVEIDWNPNYDAPSWAERYQIVYGGMSTYDSFVQYSVGRAFVPRTSAFTVNTAKKQIYVKLAPLNNYKNDKSAVSVNYSFTEGDKLRVVKYSGNGGTDPSADLVWPLANDSKTIIEFNVVGVVTLDENDNPIAPSTNPDIQHKGDFIILEAPQIAAGIESQTTNVELKYPGWDWFSVAHDADATIVYPDTTAPTIDSLWGHNSIVEILTPRTSERRLWYEIGEAGRVGGHKGTHDTNHGPNIVVSGGDCYLRTTSISTPAYNGSFQVNDNPNLYVYKNMEVESQYVSDFFQSKRWSRGRAHTTFERAATINRYNSITYSEAYSDDTSVLTLSSFNAATANFFDLPSENGKCSFIGKLGDNLLSIQENKCSLIAINKDVIQTGTQSGLVSLSTNVLNNLTQYSGFYGTENPESVLIRDSICYFADLSQSAIVKIGQKMEVLSEQDIKSNFDVDFASLRSKSGAKKVYTGYDPEDSVLYVTMRTPTETVRTYGYNEALGIWQSVYTFYPKMYASLKNTFFICQYDTTGTYNYFVHYQDETAGSNQFPGSTDKAESSFAIICNDLPSSVKAYKSLSIEGDSAWDTSLTSSSGQSILRSQMPASEFSEKEDAFYIKIPRDNGASSTSEYIPIGTSESAYGARITMNSNLRGKHMPIGYQLYKGDDTFGYVKITRVFGDDTLDSRLTGIDRSTNELIFDNRPDLAGISTTGGDTIFLAAEKTLTGDQIRGHYIRLELSKTPSGAAREEVYSVNVTYEESKANHGGTQQ